MKIRVTMKDPDVLGDAIKDAVRAEVAAIDGVDPDERVCSTWFRYSEYLTVEIDTEAKTCVVVEVRA